MCTVILFCDPLNFYKQASESEYCAWMNVSWMFSLNCLAISLPIIQLEPERPFPLAVSSKAWALITCVSGQGGRTRRSTNVGCRRAENLDLYSGCNFKLNVALTKIDTPSKKFSLPLGKKGWRVKEIILHLAVAEANSKAEWHLTWADCLCSVYSTATKLK